MRQQAGALTSALVFFFFLAAPARNEAQQVSLASEGMGKHTATPGGFLHLRASSLRGLSLPSAAWWLAVR